MFAYLMIIIHLCLHRIQNFLFINVFSTFDQVGAEKNYSFDKIIYLSRLYCKLY